MDNENFGASMVVEAAVTARRLEAKCVFFFVVVVRAVHEYQQSLVWF